MKKGFNNIEEAVIAIWETNALTEKKTILLKIISSGLYKVTNTKKIQFARAVEAMISNDKLDQFASNIMMQDSRLTASQKCL